MHATYHDEGIIMLFTSLHVFMVCLSSCLNICLYHTNFNQRINIYLVIPKYISEKVQFLMVWDAFHMLGLAGKAKLIQFREYGVMVLAERTQGSNLVECLTHRRQ